MELTFKRLVKFDLIEKFEESLFKKKNISLLMEFYNNIQEIRSIDQFIKDSPSFPGSTNKIIREELVSAIGATLAIEGTILQREEIFESFKKANLNKELKRNEQEAENSRKVFSFIIDFVNNNDKFSYNEQIIKQIHKYFTENIDYISNKPGDYRGNFTVTFGIPRIKGLCRTRPEIDIAMSNFVNWLNENKNG